MTGIRAVADSPLRGIGFMLIGMALLVPVLNAVAKLLLAEFHVIQVSWARFAGHLLFMTIIFMPRAGLRLYSTGHFGGQMARGTVMFFSNTFFLLALPSVALATATAISFSTPLLVTLFAVPLLGERVGIYRRMAVVTGLIGALIIVRPSMTDTSWASLLVLCASACFALYQVLTRRLAKDDPPETMIVYTAVVPVALLSLVAPFYFQMPETAMHWLLFGLVGLLGGLAQYFVAKALSLAPASIVAPLQYSEIITSTLIGFLLFGVLPDALTWVGAAVIVLSGLFLVYRERQLGRR